MEQFPDNYQFSDALKDWPKILAALRFTEQIRNIDVIQNGGNIKRIQVTPKSLNAVLDLRDIESTIGGSIVNRGTYMAAVGGVELDDGDYRVHIFNSSANLLVTSSGVGEALLVAGGGGGGGIGGGGAGGMLSVASHSFYVGTLPVVVGTGGIPGSYGALQPAGENGTNSSLDGMVAIGGGGGGTGPPSDGNGPGDGGSGGGSGADINGDGYGGLGTVGQGNNGADSQSSSGAGGGGAGAAGVAGSGIGAIGLASDITGTSLVYAAGGGGFNGSAGGSSGVGGTGASSGFDATAPIANRGGGGGAAYPGQVGTAGATGVVVVRYLRGPNQPRVNDGSVTYPAPNPAEEQTENEADLDRVLVSATGDVVTSREGFVLMSRNDP